MKVSKDNKIFAILTITLLSVLSVSTIIPAINAQDTEPTLKTYAFVGATPNPIGVGQEVLIRLGITTQLAADQYSWTGLTLVITAPDGHETTLGPFETDSTGGTSTSFTPDMEGTYILQSFFPEQANPADINSFGTVIAKGTIMLASSSEKVELVVQSEPIQSPIYQPLPNEYWSRPINNQYQAWQVIGGNWLMASDSANTYNRIAYGNDYAPQSPHLLWSRPITGGGLVGGNKGTTSTITEDRVTIGDAYQGKFLRSVIMLGNLYYDNYPTPSNIHEYTAVNMHTGEVLWTKTLLNNLTLAQGQLMQWNSINVVGTYPYLWATANSETKASLGIPDAGTTLCAFDPFTGEYIYSIYNVPSGNKVIGENGEMLVYTTNLAKGYMTLWNSTNIPDLWGGQEIGTTNLQQWVPEGKVVDATGISTVTPANNELTPTGYAGYEWNVTIPTGLPGSVFSVLDDRILGGTASANGVTLWAISIDEQGKGTLLFNKAWDSPSDWKEGNVTIAWQATSDESKDGIAVFSEKETRQDYAFSVETGEHLWTSDSHGYLDFYTMGLGGTSARAVNQIYDGKYYTAGYSGVLYCYDTLTGNLLWNYTAVNERALGSTFAEWPLYPMFIANGMIYVVHTEHSGYELSLPVDAPMICLNATTGDVVWRADGLIRGTHWGGYPIIGDSIIAAMNTYDMQIYAIGKGPSAINIDAPSTGITMANTITIRGSITDVSPGITQKEIQLRFPDGVPAVSDASMADWMKYVYQQTERPNAQGVDITLSVLDANGNYRTIGTTTSDSDGFYSFTWQPDIEGKYIIYASFEGSSSYYPSHAVTAFNIDPVSATPSPQGQQVGSSDDQYILPGIIGILVAIVVVGIVLALLVTRKHS